jgi:hypothetical protein
LTSDLCRCRTCQRLDRRYADDGRQLALPMRDSGINLELLGRLRTRKAAA